MSESQRVAERVQQVAAPILWALGLELVEVVCAGRGPRTVVRVFIDKPGGVSLDDCERVHQSLGPALDVADPVPHSYTLEVSSPGLDRPLKTSQDFQRAIGKLVTVKLRRPVGEQWRVRGQILTVDPDALVLVTEAAGPEATTRLALNDVVEGKLDVEF